MQALFRCVDVQAQYQAFVHAVVTAQPKSAIALSSTRVSEPFNRRGSRCETLVRPLNTGPAPVLWQERSRSQ